MVNPHAVVIFFCWGKCTIIIAHWTALYRKHSGKNTKLLTWPPKKLAQYSAFKSFSPFPCPSSSPQHCSCSAGSSPSSSSPWTPPWTAYRPRPCRCARKQHSPGWMFDRFIFCLGVKMSSLAPVWPSACLLCLTSLALLWTHRCFWGNCPTFQKGKIFNDLPVHHHHHHHHHPHHYHHHHCGLYLSISPNALSALTAWSPFPEKEINSEQKSSDIFWEPPKTSTMSINTERANHFLWHLPMARVN